MMRDRLIALRERQARLVAQAETDRGQLRRHLEPADAALAWLARGRQVIEEAKRQPLLVAAGVLLLFALRPRRVLRLAASGWSAWQLVRRARRWWSDLAPRLARAAQRTP